jgi:hypothetical protein
MSLFFLFDLVHRFRYRLHHRRYPMSFFLCSPTITKPLSGPASGIRGAILCTDNFNFFFGVSFNPHMPLFFEFIPVSVRPWSLLPNPDPRESQLEDGPAGINKNTSSRLALAFHLSDSTSWVVDHGVMSILMSLFSFREAIGWQLGSSIRRRQREKSIDPAPPMRKG